jgi:bifunctional non-homologous end joining protein LigD
MRQQDDRRIAVFVFDLLFYRGYDLRQVALIERKQLLARLLDRHRRAGVIPYCDHISGDGAQVFASACRNQLEGIVSKRADCPYVEQRSANWVKVKCMKRHEFVIGGWTEPAGARGFLGAILVGYYLKPSQLVYCGRVGTGFTRQSLSDLHELLRPLERARPPFRNPPTGVAARGRLHWARPKVIAEVVFSEWTDDGILRHASFKGIREDKEPSEVTRETGRDANPRGGYHQRNGH